MTQASPETTSHTQPFANLHGVLICPNSPSYLWPLAREHTPFELIRDESDGLSPLARSIRAIRPCCDAPLIIAASGDMAPHIRQHIAENALLADDDYQLLIEPHPRGGALTLALAAATVRLADPHAILLCLPVTVAFDNDVRWEQALRRAYQAAEAGHIALIGSSVSPLAPPVEESRQGHVAQTASPARGAVFDLLSTAYESTRSASYGAPPTDARARGAARGNTRGNTRGRFETQEHETGQSLPLLGTIRTGTELRGLEGAFAVHSFIARPTPALAWRAQQNKALWSSHIFMLGADLALAELRATGTESNDPLAHSVQRIAETARFFVSLGSEHWKSREAGELVGTLPAISFEEAVFETTAHLAAVPTSIPFTDVRTLADYEQSVEPDAKGNRLRGRALAVQTRNSTALADGGKLVVTLGLEDVVVIDTPDATLVAAKDALAQIPSVTATLRTNNAPEL
ncbi:MAG: hypothetical protein LBH56_03020 [Coriobacteriales bacterium]|jgi:mannose-1-phosphate guanylyltransferase|nr:hypothetical protein [Coriobacteriales bacterium]